MPRDSLFFAAAVGLALLPAIVGIISSSLRAFLTGALIGAVAILAAVYYVPIVGAAFWSVGLVASIFLSADDRRRRDEDRRHRELLDTIRESGKRSRESATP